MHITFDTLEMVRRLESKGFKREQAEEVISVVKDVQSELATKGDIELLRQEIREDINLFKQEIREDINLFKQEIREDINLFKKDNNLFKQEINEKINNLKQEIKASELKLTVRLSGIMFTMLLAFKVFDKFL